MKRNLVGKILGKIKIFVQDYFVPKREQNLVQKSSKIFKWPEIYSLGKILAQDFQIAAVPKILMLRDKSIAPLLSLGDNKQKTRNTKKIPPRLGDAQKV